MRRAHSPPSTRWILAPTRAGIDDYVASIEAHAAAVPAEKERLIPYVRGQLRMFQSPSEADTRHRRMRGRNGMMTSSAR